MSSISTLDHWSNVPTLPKKTLGLAEVRRWLSIMNWAAGFISSCVANRGLLACAEARVTVEAPWTSKAIRATINTIAEGSMVRFRGGMLCSITALRTEKIVTKLTDTVAVKSRPKHLATLHFMSKVMLVEATAMSVRRRIYHN